MNRRDILLIGLVLIGYEACKYVSLKLFNTLFLHTTYNNKINSSERNYN